MEILLELLFEIVFQFVGEVVLEAVFRGAARLLANRVVGTVLGAAAGLGGGYWWGARLTELGRTDPPNSLWVSIGLAAVLGASALVKVLRDDPPRFPLTPHGRASARASLLGAGRQRAWPASPW